MDPYAPDPSSSPPPNQPIVIDPLGGATPPSPLPQSPQHGPRLRWILLSLLGLLVVAAIVAIIVIVLTHQSKKPVAQAPPAHQLCFVRLNYLDCTNGVGANRIRYNLPDLPQNARTTSLIGAADQSGFLAVSPNGDGTNNIWTVSANMQAGQQLKLPSGESGATPSWSRDNQSVLLEVDGAGSSRQIERYTLATGALQQLTTTGYNTEPYQTADGHILYNHSSNGQTGWLPYIMNSDGSDPQPLNNLSSLSSVLGFSYDAPSDTIFVFGTDTNNKPAIVYGTTADFLQGRVVKTLEAPVTSGSDQIGFASSSSIIISTGNIGTILNLTKQNQTVIVKQYGNLVGVLNVSQFHKASQQVEQPYERIINLSTAPQDFVPFIESQFNAGNKACEADASAQANGVQFEMVINQVASDSFASVSQGCGTSSVVYYAKNSSGNWAEAFAAGGSTPNCSQVDAFNFTSQIIPQCYDDNGQGGNPPTNQLITNPNP